MSQENAPTYKKLMIDHERLKKILSSVNEGKLQVFSSSQASPMTSTAFSDAFMTSQDSGQNQNQDDRNSQQWLACYDGDKLAAVVHCAVLPLKNFRWFAIRHIGINPEYTDKNPLKPILDEMGQQFDTRDHARHEPLMPRVFTFTPANELLDDSLRKSKFAKHTIDDKKEKVEMYLAQNFVQMMPYSEIKEAIDAEQKNFTDLRRVHALADRVYNGDFDRKTIFIGDVRRMIEAVFEAYPHHNKDAAVQRAMSFLAQCVEGKGRSGGGYGGALGQ